MNVILFWETEQTVSLKFAQQIRRFKYVKQQFGEGQYQAIDSLLNKIKVVNKKLVTRKYRTQIKSQEIREILWKIFVYYSKSQVRINKTFDALSSRKSKLSQGSYLKFLRDFKILTDEKHIGISLKIAKSVFSRQGARELKFKEFWNIVNDLAVEFYGQRFWKYDKNILQLPKEVKLARFVSFFKTVNQPVSLFISPRLLKTPQARTPKSLTPILERVNTQIDKWKKLREQNPFIKPSASYQIQRRLIQRKHPKPLVNIHDLIKMRNNNYENQLKSRLELHNTSSSSDESTQFRVARKVSKEKFPVNLIRWKDKPKMSLSANRII